MVAHQTISVDNSAIAELCRTREIMHIHDKWIGRHIGQMPLFEALVRLNAIPEK